MLPLGPWPESDPTRCLSILIIHEQSTRADRDARQPLQASSALRMARIRRSRRTDELRTKSHRTLSPNRHLYRQLAPFDHSITSSAKASNLAGTSISRALAVFMLTTSSNFVGSSIGNSLGLAPLKILSTNAAARRKLSDSSTP